MKIIRAHSEADRQRYKLVRMDSFVDVEGEILEADEESGECVVKVDGEEKVMKFGEHGVRIVGRGRF